jgi:hypothetical protein
MKKNLNIILFIIDYYYMSKPRTPNNKKWEIYLERKLTPKEKALFRKAQNEISINKDIMNLVINLKNDKLYIPELSVSDGNCLYESLNYHIKEKDLLNIRKSVANFMRLFKNQKNIFTNNEYSLYELFIFQNEIQYILDKKTDILYNYTFDVMCSDLECDGSWERLPIELILMCVSYLYDVKITICHDNGFMHNITNTNNTHKEIYIGLLGEFHYIPLEIKKNGDSHYITDNVIVYNKYIDKFHEWKKNL